MSRLNQRVISLLLTIVTLFSILSTPVYGDGYNGRGDGATTGTVNQGGNWGTDQSGYRFTIVDRNGNLVATPVDFLFSNIPNTKMLFWTSKVEGFMSRTSQNKIVYISSMLEDSSFNGAGETPWPMKWEGGPVAQGDELRDWLTAGQEFYNSSSTPSTSTGSGTTVTNKTGVTTTTPVETEDTTPVENEDTTTTEEDTQTEETGNKIIRPNNNLSTLASEYRKAVRNAYNTYINCGYSKEEALDALITWYIPNKLEKAAKTLTETEYQYVARAMYMEYRTLSTAGMVSEYLKLFSLDSLISYADETVSVTKDIDDGYLKAMLGLIQNGEYVFQFYDGIELQKTVVDTMAANDFVLLIEPILWFKPTKLCDYTIYGTVTNLNQWAQTEIKAGRISKVTTIKGYGNICNCVGPFCLYLDKDLEFNGTTIKGVSFYDGYLTIDKVSNASYGYALHSYSAQPGGKQSTQTYDPPEKPDPHPAPDPNELPILSEQDIRTYNIVKTYVEVDENNKETHITTLSRQENPATIDIMDEPEFKVVEYIISPEYIETTEEFTWKQIKSSLSSISLNKSYSYTVSDFSERVIATATLDDPNTTLYVKLMRKTEEEKNPEEPEDPEPTENIISNQISESQLTKAISTFDSLLGRNWANYKYTAHLDAAQTTHTNGKHACYSVRKTRSDGTSYSVHRSRVTSVDHMSRADSGGDNKVWATMTGLHTPTTLETKSKTNYNSDFGSIVISGSKIGESITLDKYNGTQVISDNAYDWELDKDYTSEDGIAYFTTIWRGSKDPNVTLASYKKDSTDSTTWTRLTSLFSSGTKPAGTRMTDRVSIYKDMLITLGIKDKDDSVTSACYDKSHVCCCYNINPIKSTKTIVYSTSTGDSTSIDFTGDFSIRAYAGTTKVTSSKTINNLEGVIMSINGGISRNTAHYAKKCSSYISFYPYIRMSYMTTADGYESAGWTESEYSSLTSGTTEQKNYLTSRTAYVLSDKQSVIIPTNSLEIGWYNTQQDNGGYGLQMTSAQWSLHKAATDGSAAWKQPNQVLPGGALYTLSTAGTETVVRAVTYSTLVDDTSRSWINVQNTSDYTVDQVVSENESFAKQLIDCLENMSIVQWVNKDNSLENAWDKENTAVKVVDGGESLKNLGLQGKASTDEKYQLFNPTENNTKGASEGDIDVQKQGYNTTLYKAFTDTEGNIYVAQATTTTSNQQLTKDQLNSLVDVLKNTNGTNKTASSVDGVTVNIVRIGTKNSNIESILSALENDATYSHLYRLETRTGFISNIVNSVTRNEGNDSLNAWVDDEKWYNEAFDGIYVVQQVMTYQLGIQLPNKRVAVMDPSLCPDSSGRGDAFSNAYISQFRLDSKSLSSYATGKADGYVGTFNGMDIILPEIENMYITRPFYIPNVNVQDLT